MREVKEGRSENRSGQVVVRQALKWLQDELSDVSCFGQVLVKKSGSLLEQNMAS